MIRAYRNLLITFFIALSPINYSDAGQNRSDPYIINCPTDTLSHDWDIPFTYQFFAEDDDGDSAQVTNPLYGAVNPATGQWVLPPGCWMTGILDCYIIASDTFGILYDTCFFTLNVTNTPPEISGRCNEEIYVGAGGAGIFPFSGSDINQNDSVTITAITSPDFAGEYYINPNNDTDLIIFPHEADLGNWTFTVRAEDCAGDYDECQLYVEVCQECPMSIYFDNQRIVQDSISFEDHLLIDVYAKDISGYNYMMFDFTIAYDTLLFQLLSVQGGDLHDEEIYAWEYLNYEILDPSNCTGDCPNGLFKVLAISDILNGTLHSFGHDWVLADSVLLFTAEFDIADDTVYTLNNIPLQFYWTSCEDNVVRGFIDPWYCCGYEPGCDTICDYAGATRFYSKSVYGVSVTDTFDLTNYYYTMGGDIYSYFGTPEFCLPPFSGDTIFRTIDFYSNLPENWFDKPFAVIDSINPDPAYFGDEIIIGGHGISYGDITEYSWRSSLDGQLSTDAEFRTTSLSTGEHIIYFKVRQAQDGIWSSEIAYPLEVRPDRCLAFDGLFCDNFDGTLNPGWTQTEGGCTWQITDSRLNSSMSGGQLSCVLSAGDESWRNYVVEARVMGNSGVDKIVRFRQENDSTRYFINLRSEWQGKSELLLGKQVNGIETILKTSNYESFNDAWYHLEIACVDEKISISVNCREIISYIDYESHIYSGGIGLVCFTGGFGECDISFDFVSVTDPFPKLVYDVEEPSFNLGENITISGTINTGIYPDFIPTRGNLYVYDPLDNNIDTITTDEFGWFEYVSDLSATASGMYMYYFELFTDTIYDKSGGGGRSWGGSSSYNVPIVSTPSGDLPSSRLFRVNSGEVLRPYGPADYAVSSWPTFDLYRGYDMQRALLRDAARSMASSLVSDVLTSFERYMQSPEGSFGFQLIEKGVMDCLNPFDCPIRDIQIGAMLIGFGTATNIPVDKIQQGNDLMYNENIIDECTHSEISAAISAGSFIVGMGALGSGNLIDAATALNMGGEYTGFIETAENSFDACVPKSGENPYPIFAGLFECDFADIGFFCLIPKIDNAVVINGYSPIDLYVERPDGNYVNKDTSTIPGAYYWSADMDLDGDEEPTVIVPMDSLGDVTIQIIPKPGADPSDTFSVVANYTYYQEPIIIAENLPVSEIPVDPVIIETFENLPPGEFNLITPDTSHCGGFPCLLEWSRAVDPNINHIVTYDIIAAKSPDFSDSLMVGQTTDTSFYFNGILTQPNKDSIDTVAYYWKVNAHDDWGAASTTMFRSLHIEYLCGDANGDEVVNIFDVTALISYLYLDGFPPNPFEAVDVNDDGTINIFDIAYLISYLYISGPDPECN